MLKKFSIGKIVFLENVFSAHSLALTEKWKNISRVSSQEKCFYTIFLDIPSLRLSFSHIFEHVALKMWEKIDAESLHAFMQSKISASVFCLALNDVKAFESFSHGLWKIFGIFFFFVASASNVFPYLTSLLLNIITHKGFSPYFMGMKNALRWNVGGETNVWVEKLWIIVTKCPRKSDKLLNNSQSRFAKKGSLFRLPPSYPISLPQITPSRHETNVIINEGLFSLTPSDLIKIHLKKWFTRFTRNETTS
jgi:hypothetical protein